MKDRVKSNKRLLAVLVLVILICGVFAGKKAVTACAQEELFSIDAQLHSQRRMAHTCYIPWGGILW